jgi:penicillin amidase
LVRFFRSARDFSVLGQGGEPPFLVRWPIYAQTRSSIETMLALDAARSVRDGLRVLSHYAGSPQNFVLADARGAIAYHVAGVIPNDPAWGRYVHPARDTRRSYVIVPFDALPSSGPAREGVVVSANNRSYGARYPYRLSAQFEPPYRAYRIARLLDARSRYDAGYFSAMQLDTFSPIDAEIARDVLRVTRTAALGADERQAFATLQGWNGRFDPNSRGAAIEHAVRFWLVGGGLPLGPRLLELRSGDSDWSPGFAEDVSASLVASAFDRRDWGKAGSIRIEHPLAPMHFGFLNGDVLPGSGNEDTIRLQEPGFAQGFRAVWDTGDWNRGGIDIPSGESGEPGSKHYTDLTPAWIAGALQPLPFGDDVVRRHTRETLRILPARLRPEGER